ncbi:MAG: hypothetical protein ABJF88_05875 [Rhodothermales bacterium]
MSGEDVAQLIEAEVAGDWSRPNAHGCTIRRCLVEPQKLAFVDPLNSDTVDLWLVLEEDRKSCDGYKVVYDDVNESFGLATTDSTDKRVFLGLYGGFLDAYDAM